MSPPSCSGPGSTSRSWRAGRISRRFERAASLCSVPVLVEANEILVSVFCPSPTEGAPRAVILAMLTSRPCLSTGAEGVADIINPAIGKITSPENDVAALADAIRPYVDDPERVAREGAEARRQAEQTYAAPVVAKQLEDLFLLARES